MNMLQNDVVLLAMQSLSGTLQSAFLEKGPFHLDLWRQFFELAVTYITQPALQLEEYSEAKRNKILLKYEDKRAQMAPQVTAMWTALDMAHKMRFLPALVRPFLEMTLVPEVSVRKEAIPLIADMIECELRVSQHFQVGGARVRGEMGVLCGSRAVCVAAACPAGAHSCRFLSGVGQGVEKEITDKLDLLVSGGRGDDEYKELFVRGLNKRSADPEAKYSPAEVTPRLVN